MDSRAVKALSGACLDSYARTANFYKPVSRAVKALSEARIDCYARTANFYKPVSRDVKALSKARLDSYARTAGLYKMDSRDVKDSSEAFLDSYARTVNQIPLPFLVMGFFFALGIGVVPQANKREAFGRRRKPEPRKARPFCIAKGERPDEKIGQICTSIIRLITIYNNIELIYNNRMQVRNSNQRKIILDIMRDNFTHPTADEIYEKARAIDGHISRGTVYRNLGFLSETGEILKISVPNGSDHYDCRLHEHYHFCCSKCGKMYDVPGTINVETKMVSEEMAKDGFCVDSHNLIFSGLCPSCNKN